jgi:hypothetical protein
VAVAEPGVASDGLGTPPELLLSFLSGRLKRLAGRRFWLAPAERKPQNLVSEQHYLGGCKFDEACQNSEYHASVLK